MAKGKGEVAGWITRNGVHVPIYGNYTVRGGEEPKAKGSKFKGAGKKRKKVDTSTTSGKTANDLNSNLKKKGLELDSADLSSMAHKDFNDEKVTMYDKDGNTYEGTYNKYKNGDREIVDIKKTGGRDTGKSEEVSKGHTEEGKGAVKNVEGKKPEMYDWKQDRTDTQEERDAFAKEHEQGIKDRLAKINEQNKPKAKEETFKGSVLKKSDEKGEGYDWKKDRSDELDSDEIFEARERTYAKDEAAKKEGFLDAADKESFDAREKAYETRGLRGQAEKSSKVDRKQDAIDYIAKREDVHPSVAKDTYEHMSESERNHVANEAFKSRTGSKANTLKITDEYWKDSNVSTMFPSFNGITSEQTATRVVGDSKFYGKKLNSVEHVSYDNKNHAYIGSQPAYFDDDKAKGDTVYTVRGLDKNGHAGRVYRYNNESEARQKADTLAGLKSTQDSPSAKEAKGSIPTTVSGLRSAYSEATGSEKAAIASELRKKGYSLIGGKWVKGK